MYALSVFDEFDFQFGSNVEAFYPILIVLIIIYIILKFTFKNFLEGFS